MRQDIYYSFDTDQEEFRDTFSKDMENPDEIWFYFSSSKPVSFEKFQQTLEKLKSQHPNKKIKVKSVRFSVDKGYIYDKKEIEYYKDFSEKLQKAEGISARIWLKDGGGYVEQVVVARDKIEEFVEKLNKTTIEQDGKQVPLSVAEKFMCIYRFASDRLYNENENFGDDNMRNWVGLLSTEYAICSGFSSLLKCLCDRVFTEQELKCFEQSSNVFDKQTGELLGGHSNTVIIIKDPKYNLDGVYYCDPCWDCKKSESGTTNFAFFMLPISKIFDHVKRDVEFEETMFIYKPYQKTENDDVLSRVFSSRENPFNGFLYQRLGYETYDDLYQKFGGEKLIEQRRVEIEEYNQNLKNHVEEVFDKVSRQHSLQKIFKTEIIYYYPRSVYEKYPEIEQIIDYFRNISVKDLEKPEFVQNVKALKKFIDEHQDLHQRVTARAKEVNLNIACEFGEFVKANAYQTDSQYYSEFNERCKLEEKTKKAYQAQKEKILAKNRQFICSQPIPRELFFNGLKAIAKIEGIEPERYAEFEQKQVDYLKEANEKHFGESTDAQTTNNFDCTDEFSK